MKRKLLIIVVLAMMMSIFCMTCNAESEYDQIIELAIDSFSEKWKAILTDENCPTDGYLSINNTRIIVLKNNPTFTNETCKLRYEEMFKGSKYVVEFLFYTDYFASAPYYFYPGINDAVLVYEDGNCETVTNPISKYRSYTFETDFSGFIDKCVDLGEDYNQKFDFVVENKSDIETEMENISNEIEALDNSPKWREIITAITENNIKLQ